MRRCSALGSRLTGHRLTASGALALALLAGGSAVAQPAAPAATATAPTATAPAAPATEATPTETPAPLLGAAPAPAAPAPAAATPAPAAPTASKEPPKERPSPTNLAVPPPSEVFAEDWWNQSRPTFELHGAYRVRSELFHKFDLGRIDRIKPFYPRPSDDSYVPLNGGTRGVKLCGDSGSPSDFSDCSNRTQAGANMRLRLNPDLHISDNLRIRAQIDLLDNIVLGSTPEGYGNQPGQSGGYQVIARGGYAPLSAFSTTQWAPVAGFNSVKDSITVKRAWGEYSSPVGQLRFGRMPSHWGLGMLVNSGDGYDSDWQTTADRIMFVTGHPGWDLYGAFAWDFANEGPISASLQEAQGQPYDLAQKDDVDQLVFVLMRRRNEQLARKDLAAGKPVIEGGGYFVYRHQTLANDTTDQASGASIGQDPDNLKDGFVRRQATAFIPDVWFRFRWKKFRFETEAALIAGTIENTLRQSNNYLNTADPSDNGWKLLQFGVAAQGEVRLLEDKLNLTFDFGYATGDSDVDSLAPIGNELQPQKTLDRTFSTFRFHPDYRVDLILYRNILSRIQGTYFFKPSVGYEFLRDPDGQKLGGAASLVWSRASEFVQVPGNASDLGVEINVKLYYQAKDGVLNDDLERMGGFYTSLEYGVLFPLQGLGYLPGQVNSYAPFQPPGSAALDTENAQMLRWWLGILY
ncbi:MAG: TIGR04551 family protein [Deltaproteobacteria bacterium]|nr:TIGR04551 family protein [Deltaproteobacteria bacterium]